MDLSTKYLGLALEHPLMPGASPLCDSLDGCKRLEDVGAAALVLRSLFEEQITREELGVVHDLFVDEAPDADALREFPEPTDFAFAPDTYLEHVRRVKAAVGVPVIASLNGTGRAGWLAYARDIEEAGADSIELNIYHVPADSHESGLDVERRLLNAVRQVKWSVKIPVAVKLSPFFSSIANLASELDSLGADGLVLFNRFYQPDIDPEMLLAAPDTRRIAPARPLAGDSVRAGGVVAGGNGWRSRCVRCAQGHHGRGRRGAGRVRASRTRRRPPPGDEAGPRSLARATRVRLAAGGARQRQSDSEPSR